MTPRAPQNRRRRLLFVGVTVCLTGMICVSILEVACRMLGFGPVPPTVATAIDPDKLHSEPWLREAQQKRWVHPPFRTTTVSTDEHSSGSIIIKRNNCGFREDADTPISKPEGTFRILVLGDSHTDGVCLNTESYANLLEADLNASDLGQKFDVINAGQVTFSPYQEWWLYETIGRRFSPDLIIVGMYAGNDYWDLMQRKDRVHLAPAEGGFVHAEPAPAPTSTSPPTNAPEQQADSQSIARRLKNVVRDYSSTYHALASIDSLRTLFGNPPRYSPLELRIQKLAPMAQAAYWQSLGQAAHFASAPGDLPVADAAWRHTVRLFESSAARDGAELLFLVIPSLQEICPEIDPDGLSTATATLELTPEQANLSSRVRTMAATAVRDSGYEVFDLFDELSTSRKTNPSNRLFYRFDHHLAPDGQRVVADALLRRLRNHFSKAAPLHRASPSQ